MSIRVHEIQLQSDQHFAGKLPPRFLGYFLAELPIVIQQTISMALRGRSSLQGGRPQWLERAADIRFTDHGGNGSSVLFFEAPTLGDAASELYQQGELWPTRPDGEDTGFDLLGDVLADVSATNADSDHYDKTLLKRLMCFKRVFMGPFRQIELTTRRYDTHHPSRLTPATLQTVQTLLGDTPAAKRVRIVGTLDMIRVSTQTFGVRLDKGEEVRGVMPDGSIDVVKGLLNQRVLILGKAIYRPSGRLLRVDAEEVSATTDKGSFFSTIPKPSRKRFNLREVLREQAGKGGIAAIMGKWPGDETDEEVAAALAELS